MATDANPTDAEDEDVAPWFKYQASIDPDSDHNLGVVDGDTFDLLIDMGFRHYRRMRVRLRDVDTAEIHGEPEGSEERRRGLAHAEYAEEWIGTTVQGYSEMGNPSMFPQLSLMQDTGFPFVFLSVGDTGGKYGRWVGDLIAKEPARERLQKKGLKPSLSDSLVSMYPETDPDSDGE